MSHSIVARAPTRLDFGGGWTDVPPYCEREGGAVCSVAIARYATATASLGEELRKVASSRPRDALTEAALASANISGACAFVSTDYPTGAGLGGSSACGVALAGALAALRGEQLEPAELAARSRETEVNALGVAGGYQDHYAAAFGGALLLRFSDCVAVESLTMSRQLGADLARRGVLLYTGESRLSGSTIAAVSEAYQRSDSRTCESLARMKALAVDMAAALRRGDLDALGELIGEHWVHQRALHPSITTPRIDAIVETAARAGALGVKALGASGGGCVLAFARDDREEELARALAPLGERLHYAVDESGFQVLAVLDEQHESREPQEPS